MENVSFDMVQIAYNALDEKKGEDIKIIDIAEISSIADYFVIVNGNNPAQLRAMYDEVEDKLSKAGYEPKRVEGIRSDSWILLDYGDIIIHIFSKEDREFYDLERIWVDGKIVQNEDLMQVSI